jgi:hypothetical protein
MILTRMVAVLLPLFVGCALSVGLALGQDKEKKSPLERFEPRSQPGIGQKFLEHFVGEWDVVKTFYPQSGAPVKMEGTCSQTMVQNGRFLHSAFTFRKGTSTTTGLGIVGYEPENGLFSSDQDGKANDSCVATVEAHDASLQD